jgi:hypothetical protein
MVLSTAFLHSDILSPRALVDGRVSRLNCPQRITNLYLRRRESREDACPHKRSHGGNHPPYRRHFPGLRFVPEANEFGRSRCGIKAQYAMNATNPWIDPISAIEHNCAKHLKTIDVSQVSFPTTDPLIESFSTSLTLNMCICISQDSIRQVNQDLEKAKTKDRYLQPFSEPRGQANLFDMDVVATSRRIIVT